VDVLRESRSWKRGRGVACNCTGYVTYNVLILIGVLDVAVDHYMMKKGEEILHRLM